MSPRQFVPQPHKRKNIRMVIAVAVLVVIFAAAPLRNGVRRGISDIGLGIARATRSIGVSFASIGTSVRSKYALQTENTALEAQVDDLNGKLSAYNTLLNENTDLEAAMGRTDTAHFTLAAVLEKPPHSLYDTMIIDGGSSAGFAVGQIVYANGETPIGAINEVLPSSAVVELYSAPGQSFDARLSPSDIDITLSGRGGGDFSATVPHDVVVGPGSVVVTKEIVPYTVAVFQKITSDPRDPFQTLLLSSPVNINELAFVEVRQDQPEAEIAPSKISDSKTPGGTD